MSLLTHTDPVPWTRKAEPARLLPVRKAVPLKKIVSPDPTPAPAALLLMVTVVPVAESTYVPVGIALGVVASKTLVRGKISEGVDEKCKIALPEAVEELVVPPVVNPPE